MLKGLFEGWRGALAASLATALLFLALNGPPDHEYVAGQVQPGAVLALLFSPDMLLVYFTAALFGVGVLTYFTFNAQARTMAEQIKLSRDEFDTTHRPRIRLRQIRDEAKSSGKNFEIHFTCINVGDLPCDILEIAIRRASKPLMAVLFL